MKNISTLFRLMLAAVASAPLLFGQSVGADPALRRKYLPRIKR